MGSEMCIRDRKVLERQVYSTEKCAAFSWPFRTLSSVRARFIVAALVLGKCVNARLKLWSFEENRGPRKTTPKAVFVINPAALVPCVPSSPRSVRSCDVASREQHRVRRFLFDVSYWVLVPLLLLNMVSGVILDRQECKIDLPV